LTFDAFFACPAEDVAKRHTGNLAQVCHWEAQGVRLTFALHWTVAIGGMSEGTIAQVLQNGADSRLLHNNRTPLRLVRALHAATDAAIPHPLF
jgi:hypothetical protein